VVEFDVRDLNVGLNRAKRRDKILLWINFGVVASLTSLLLVAFRSGVGPGELGEVRIFMVASCLGCLAYVCYVMNRGFRNKRLGANFVRVTEEGVELVYPDRASDLMKWTDPALTFSIHDLSSLDPKMLTTSTPYFLYVKEVPTALNVQAHDAIVSEARARAISVRPGESGGLWKSTVGNILIYGN
jgi:hypothetical protein